MPWEGFFAFTGADWALGGDDGGVAEESESQTRPGYKGSPQAGLAAAEAGAVDLAESQTTPGKADRCCRLQARLEPVAERREAAGEDLGFRRCKPAGR